VTLPATGQTERMTVADRVVVFACGDPLRGDDAVAPLVVKSLFHELPPGAVIRLVGALEAEYLVDLASHTRVIIVDAVVGPEPGAIVQMDLREMSGRAEAVVTTSTHQLPLDQVVAIAQLLRDEPIEGVFVGVGIEAVAHGEALSGPVEAAVPAFREAIRQAVSRFA
jgi:hydrogenase maturation protease